jgi:hypothetical protein
MRTIGKVVLAPTIASGLIAGGAGAAHAAPAGYPGWFHVNGAVIYSNDSASARVNGYGYSGQEFYVYSSIGDWDYGQNLSTSCKGWTGKWVLTFS